MLRSARSTHGQQPFCGGNTFTSIPTTPDPVRFFRRPRHPVQLLYEALRAYFLDDRTASEVAQRFGYTPDSIRVLASKFSRGQLPPFFRDPAPGRPVKPPAESFRTMVLQLRAQNLSIYDIAERVTAAGRHMDPTTVWRFLRTEGEQRLPKRGRAQRLSIPKLHPPVADVHLLNLTPGRVVECRAPLLFLFAPLLAHTDFESVVRRARYPGSSMIGAPAALRALLALKLLSRDRKSAVMPVADDEGFGLFVGLNVFPKTTYLSDYSYRIGAEPHRVLLRGIVRARSRMAAYPSLSFNMDFHTIRHYGEREKSFLEKDYAPRRSQSVNAVVTAFAQEIDSREMVYAHANLLKREKGDEVLRFVEYWEQTTGKRPAELVLDSDMTTHAGLAGLHRRGILFLKLRDRKPKEVARVLAVPADRWRRVELDIEDRKWRTPRVLDERISVEDYPGEIRQIAAMDLGREKPTLLLTNDLRRGPAALLTRYARRTLIENSLGEQVHHFHVDALSSSVRIKVDLDVVLSVVASGCYRWLAQRLKGFEMATAQTLWETFLDRPGKVRLTEDDVVVEVRRFSRAPVLLEAERHWKGVRLPWLEGRSVRLRIT